MKSAWLNLRRSRYFIGPYNQTPDSTIVGEPPYSVLPEGSAPHQLGGAIRLALEASMQEAVAGDDALELAEKRTLELARLAGVKDRRTFERGARLVNFDCVIPARSSSRLPSGGAGIGTLCRRSNRDVFAALLMPN